MLVAPPVQKSAPKRLPWSRLGPRDTEHTKWFSNVGGPNGVA